MRTLYFKPINDTETEVWHEGQDHRTLPTEAVHLALGQVLNPDVFRSFRKAYPEPGGTAQLDDPNNDGLATHFEIR